MAEAAPDTGSENTPATARGQPERRPPSRFEDWIDATSSQAPPAALNFKHTLLPHVPWQFLPSGDRYRSQPNDVIPGLSNQSYNDQGQLDVLLQRHFLQTGFADLQLQKLWRHLKREGLWDNSLIVVAADHGVAFMKGGATGAGSTAQNSAEIAPIPLFIKAPGQKKGKVNDAYVETIDILPTIFDILNIDPKVKMDGHSAFSPRSRSAGRCDPRAATRSSRCASRPSEFEREKAMVRERNQRLFGIGRGRPRPHLPDRPATRSCSAAASRRAGGRGSVELRLRRRRLRATWTRAPTSCPSHVVGSRERRRSPSADIAVAVNGRIRRGGQHLHSSPRASRASSCRVMVPESSFRRGRNRWTSSRSLPAARSTPRSAASAPGATGRRGSSRPSRAGPRIRRCLADEQQRAADLLGALAVALELRASAWPA